MLLAASQLLVKLQLPDDGQHGGYHSYTDATAHSPHVSFVERAIFVPLASYYPNRPVI